MRKKNEFAIVEIRLDTGKCGGGDAEDNDYKDIKIITLSYPYSLYITSTFILPHNSSCDTLGGKKDGKQIVKIH